MNFKFEEKEFDSEKLSDNGKLYLAKLQQCQAKQQQLNLDITDINILYSHYANLLKAELPKNEEVKEEKKDKAN
tara:strand:- start:1057 stop:1278 length:222 start_codon:yes stop_codon:yes gene_type:complete